MLILDLAIELLQQDGGISQEAYEILIEMLDGDLDITQHVEATDGRFYLPDGWTPNSHSAKATSCRRSKQSFPVPHWRRTTTDRS